MKKTGSALIIAISLIAAIGGIAFAIAKLVYFQSSTYSAQENGIVAYYAAESGIEEAFLRYRYNQDSTVPGIYGFGGNSVYSTVLDFRVYRSNLSDKTTEVGNQYNGSGVIPRAGYMGIDKRGSLGSSTEQMYDLRFGSLGTMNYTGSPPTNKVMPYFGQELASIELNKNLYSDDLASASYGLNDFSFLRIPKDESLKIPLNNYNFNSANPGLNLIVKYYGVNDSNDECDAAAEVTLRVDYGTTSNPDVKEFKEIITHNSVQCATEMGIDSGKLIPLSVTDATYDATNKTFYYSANGFDTLMFSRAGVEFPSGKKAVLSIKPLHYDAAIGLVANRCSSIFWAGNTECHYEVGVPAGPVTRVESTGYFGGVTRNLYANIDRQSGSLYDLFDYVLYSNE